MDPRFPFLLFAGANYYPDGGWHDFRGAYQTLESARAELDSLNKRLRAGLWAHVVDIRTENVVWDNAR
jgi:hypothetical protein